MPINTKSLVKSGLIAGVVVNISGMTMLPVVGDQMNTVLKDHLCPPLSPMAMIFFLVLSMILGFSAVTIYAFTKSLFKTKLQAAATVAFSIWF